MTDTIRISAAGANKIKQWMNTHPDIAHDMDLLAFTAELAVAEREVTKEGKPSSRVNYLIVSDNAEPQQ